MQKVKFNVQGMNCSSCSSHVEKANEENLELEEIKEFTDISGKRRT